MTNTLDLNNFNTFIEQARQTIMCDSECQIQKQNDILKQQYIDAQTNLATAPQQVELTQKNYITFSQGESAYNDFEDELITKKATNIITYFYNTFEKDSNKINNELLTYDNLYIHFKNIIDLYKHYKKENIILAKELKENVNDVITNDRKTFYENQGIEYLKFIYHYIFIFIYILIIILYIIISFGLSSRLSLTIRISILISLIILPFLSSYLIELFIRLCLMIYYILPKNAYLHM
jgi:hypothetical protein